MGISWDEVEEAA